VLGRNPAKWNYWKVEQGSITGEGKVCQRGAVVSGQWAVVRSSGQWAVVSGQEDRRQGIGFKKTLERVVDRRL
jgi:hypothetical protein